MTEHDGVKRSKTELLPCPFCGGKAVIRIDATRPYTYRDRLRVGCETAGCRGFYHAAWAYYETPEQAAEAWNTRAQQADAKSRYYELFGTPEKVARLIIERCCMDCIDCLMPRDCPCKGSSMADDKDYERLLEWLRGDA